MTLNDHPKCRPFTEAGPLTQVNAWYEEGRHILWIMLAAKPRPCFSQSMLKDIAVLARAIHQFDKPIDFIVSGSAIPGMYNAGGDLDFFARSIRARDQEGLMSYARACVDAVFENLQGFGVNAITIAMIEGSALGGGFEAALSHDFVLGQKGARMGFPEIAFNLFPGMGAYSLVARKANRHLAEQLILGGETFSAEWFFDRHLVDRLFEPGQGFNAARGLVDELRPKKNGARAMIRARNIVSPLPKSELIAITEEWVLAAMNVEEKDIAHMERLVMLQNRRDRITPVSFLKTIENQTAQG